MAVFAALLLLGCLALVGALYPRLGFAQTLSSYIPFAQLAAFPRVTGIALVLMVVIISVTCWRKRHGRLMIACCLAWTLAGASFSLFPYGIPDTASRPQGNPSRSLRIVTFNSGSTLTSSDLKKLIDSQQPNVIVLPETSGYDVRQAMESIHYPGYMFETPDTGFSGAYNGKIAPTTIITDKDLGTAHYVRGPATSFGTMAIKFDDPRIPTIVGVHAAPPLPTLMRQWREDNDRVMHFGESYTRPIIIAGDFNATLRHGALATRSKLVDSQEFCAGSHLGTWPATMPGILRTPIDHVFISLELAAQSCKAVDIGESDHLAYITDVLIP